MYTYKNEILKRDKIYTLNIFFADLQTSTYCQTVIN